MNEKGFLLIQVLLGLFILGLITLSTLPILNTSINNLMISETKMEMAYIAESTIEQIKSFDLNNGEEPEFIFDIPLKELIEILENHEEVNVFLPLDDIELEYKYSCHINKVERDNLWEIKINISSKDKVKKINNVEMLAFLPKPK